jgi:hypothetical protein
MFVAIEGAIDMLTTYYVALFVSDQMRCSNSKPGGKQDLEPSLHQARRWLQTSLKQSQLSLGLPVPITTRSTATTRVANWKRRVSKWVAQR